MGCIDTSVPVFSTKAAREQRKWKHHTFVALAVIANTLGNFLLSLGMRGMNFRPSASALDYLRIFANPWIDLGVALLIIWFGSQLSLLSWSDLSYVVPATAASYVLTAMLGILFLHEFVSPLRWTGIFVISVGVMVVIGTSPRSRLRAPEISS